MFALLMNCKIIDLKWYSFEYLGVQVVHFWEKDNVGAL